MSITRRVQLWALMGPLFVAATLLVALLKQEIGQAALGLACIAVAAIPICWHWKMKGLLVSVVVLCLLLACTYTGVPPYERFWYLGTILSAALALTVTTLCFEEIEEQIKSVSVESESRLDTLVRVDERLQETKQAWERDREELVARLQNLTKELEEKETRILTFQKVIRIVRQDLERAQQERTDLMQRLYDSEWEEQQLRQQLLELDSDNGEADDQWRVLARERLTVLNKLRCELYQVELNAQQKESCEHILQHESSRGLREVEGRYRQLRGQFAEKQAMLDATRRELFHLREQLLAYDHAVAETEKQSHREWQAMLESCLSQASRELESERVALQEEIEQLESLIRFLFQQLDQKAALCIF